MSKPNKQASTVSWFGKSGSRTTDGGDSIRTLSRTAKRKPLARNENDSPNALDFGGSARDQDLCNRHKARKQKSAHRGKIAHRTTRRRVMKRVLAAPEKGSSDLKIPFLVSRDSFDSELESMYKLQTARVTSRKKSKSSKARRHCATVPAVMSALISPNTGPARGPGLGSTSPDRSKARPRQRSAERPGLALELEVPFSPFTATLSRFVKM